MTDLVTAVVCAAFDERTDAAVLAVRDRVAASGVRLAARPRHRPHLTLAAVRVHPAQLPQVVDLVWTVARTQDPLELRLDRIGSFTRAGALWLGPVESAGLRALQRSVHAATVAGPWPSAFGGRTEPGPWVPHCSLATRLDPVTLARARAGAEQAFVAIDAHVVAVAVVLVGGTGDVGLVPLGGPAHAPPAVTIASVAKPASRPTSNP